MVAIGNRMMASGWLAVVFSAGLWAIGCRTADRVPHVAEPSVHMSSRELTPVERGAVLYEAYCAACHGPEGLGDGPVAMVLNLRPAKLHGPVLAQASDRELVARLLHGDPLRVSPGRSAVAEELQVSALAEYLPTLSRQNWAQLRTGRAVYESGCAPCHGAYGKGDGVLGSIEQRPPADLEQAQKRYSDPTLAQVVVGGIGAMPALSGAVDSREVAAVIAYVRHLSKGYRLYDTYCAGCHGDDGLGVHIASSLPAPMPVTPVPPLHSQTLARLSPDKKRAKILHMLRRAQSLMPHFDDTLDERELREILAYIRSWQS